MLTLWSVAMSGLAGRIAVGEVMQSPNALVWEVQWRVYIVSSTEEGMNYRAIYSDIVNAVNYLLSQAS